jgi:hypothetical protein
LFCYGLLFGGRVKTNKTIFITIDNIQLYFNVNSPDGLFKKGKEVSEG